MPKPKPITITTEQEAARLEGFAKGRSNLSRKYNQLGMYAKATLHAKHAAQAARIAAMLRVKAATY